MFLGLGLPITRRGALWNQLNSSVFDIDFAQNKVFGPRMNHIRNSSMTGADTSRSVANAADMATNLLGVSGPYLIWQATNRQGYTTVVGNTITVRGDGTNTGYVEYAINTVTGRTYTVTYEGTGTAVGLIVGTAPAPAASFASTTGLVGQNAWSFTAQSSTSYFRFTKTTDADGVVLAPKIHKGLVGNGTFSTDIRGWTHTAPSGNTGTSEWVDGSVKFTVSTGTFAGRFVQPITTVPGRTYRLSINARVNAGSGPPTFGLRATTSSDGSSTGQLAAVALITANVDTTSANNFVAVGTTTYISAFFNGLPGEIGYLNEVSVTEANILLNGDFSVPDLVTNGRFDANITGWTATGGSWVSGVMRLSASTPNQGAAYQAVTCIVGRSYTVKYDAVATVGTTGWVGVSTTTASAQAIASDYNFGVPSLNRTLTFTATATTMYLLFRTNGGTTGNTVDYDNISCTEGWLIKGAAVGTEQMSISGGVANLQGDATNPAWIDQSFPTVSGRFYTITYTVSNAAALNVGTTQGSTGYVNTFINPSVGTYAASFQATASLAWIRIYRTSAGNITVDNVTIIDGGKSPTNWTGLSLNTVGIGTTIVSLENEVLGIRYTGTTINTNPITFTPDSQAVGAIGQTWTNSINVRLAAGSMATTSNNLTLRAGAEAGGTVFLPTSTMARYTNTRVLTATAEELIIRWTGAAIGSVIDFTIEVSEPQTEDTLVATPYIRTDASNNNFSVPDDFANAAWTKTSATITSNTVWAPNGQPVADKLVSAAATAYTYVSQNVTTVIGSTYTVSVFARAAEWGHMTLQTGTSVEGANGGIRFQLSSGTIAAANNGQSTANGVITNIGGGWYRCSMRFTASTTTTSLLIMQSLLNSSTTPVGDGTSGIYIWGASHDLGDSPKQYQGFVVDSLGSIDALVSAARSTVGYAEDTAGNWTSFAANTPRRTNKGLIVEGVRINNVRNNSMQGAVAGTPGTSPTNWGLSAGTGLTRTIIGTGTENGIEYIDVRFQGTTGDANGTDLSFELANQIAALPAQVWAASAFVSMVAGSTANITNFQYYQYEYSAAAAFLAAGAQTFTPTTTLTRYFYVRTLSHASTAFVRPLIKINTPSGVAVDITLRVGWPQLEQGAYASTPIRTTNTAASRAAEAVSSTNAALAAQLRGQPFSVRYALRHGAGLVQSGIFIQGRTAGGTTVRLEDRHRGTPNEGYGAAGDFDVTGAALAYASVVAGTQFAANTRSVFAARHRSNQKAGAQNGGAIAAAAAGAGGINVSDIEQLYFGANVTGSAAFDGYIERVTIYGDKTDAELVALSV